jgi:ribonucleotide reductase beta subunit family protein with ferritin-like domain
MLQTKRLNGLSTYKDGDLIGLNADIPQNYMKYLVNLRMKNMGMKQIFERTKNPITG